MSTAAMYGEKGKPVIVCNSMLNVVNIISRKNPLSQKPVCQPSQLYKRLIIRTFTTPNIIGWIPYEINRKSAKPIGDM
jgi:hypothetical protein